MRRRLSWISVLRSNESTIRSPRPRNPSRHREARHDGKDRREEKRTKAGKKGKCGRAPLPPAPRVRCIHRPFKSQSGALPGRSPLPRASRENVSSLPAEPLDSLVVTLPLLLPRLARCTRRATRTLRGRGRPAGRRTNGGRRCFNGPPDNLTTTITAGVTVICNDRTRDRRQRGRRCQCRPRRAAPSADWSRSRVPLVSVPLGSEAGVRKS